MHLRNNQSQKSGFPIHVHDKKGQDIGEKQEREPLEEKHIAAVTYKHLRREAECGEGDDTKTFREADQKRGCVRHGIEIGADIDQVGKKKTASQDVDDNWREMLFKNAAQAETCCAPHPARHHLNGRHQRKR